jgi:hypothetical protein
MSQNSSLVSRRVWFTQSYTLVRSQKIPPTVSLLLRASKILVIRLYEAVSVDKLVLKPYCSCASILLLLIWLHNLLKMIFSNVLEKDVSELTWKDEQTIDIRRSVRLAHSSVHTVCNNADKFKESAKCLDNITCQQSEIGIVCLHNKSTTVLSGWTTPNTVGVSLLHYYWIRNK